MVAQRAFYSYAGHKNEKSLLYSGMILFVNGQIYLELFLTHSIICDQAIIFLCPYMLFFVWSDHFIYFLCLWTSCFVFTNEYSNYRSFLKKGTINLDVMAHGRNNYIFPWIKKRILYLLGYHQLTRILYTNTHLLCNLYMRWTSLQSSWLLFVALSTSNNLYIHWEKLNCMFSPV